MFCGYCGRDFPTQKELLNHICTVGDSSPGKEEPKREPEEDLDRFLLAKTLGSQVTGYAMNACMAVRGMKEELQEEAMVDVANGCSVAIASLLTVLRARERGEEVNGANPTAMERGDANRIFLRLVNILESEIKAEVPSGVMYEKR
jgi:hypothetical protein